MKTTRILWDGIKALIIVAILFLAIFLMMEFMHGVRDGASTRNLIVNGIGSLLLFQLFKIDITVRHRGSEDY